ncbi:MAG: replication protein [Caldisericaceae bacterium]
MNGIARVKKSFTQIPNKMMEIFIKGLLGETEMRIAIYIIRQSIGYQRVWTNETTIKKIAKDIGISRSFCSKIISKMLRENKITRDSSRLKFNDNYSEWVVLTNRNAECEVNETQLLSNRNTQELASKEQINASDMSKYTLNKILNKKKEIIKERSRKSSLGEKDSKDKEPVSAINASVHKEKVGVNTLQPLSGNSAKIVFNEQAFKFENIPKEKMNKWIEAFPDSSIDLEIKRMEAWLMANPKNKKVNYERFIVNWLNRARSGLFSRAKGGADGAKEPERIKKTGFYDISGRRIS